MKLDVASRLYRSPVLRKPVASVEPDAGDYSAGLIRGAAVITRGEALGHGMWIDSEMLSQVEKSINAEPKGSKSRFSHPGMSGDGLGKALGRFQEARIDGAIVRADLHFYESAHKTPDGDLAAYLMDLAREDSEAFGLSIAFEPDFGAEHLFVAEHENKDGEFTSPDEDNAKQLPHARLALLQAVDVVDSPAANPGGLFHRGHEVVLEADALAAYALCLSDNYTECGNLGLGLAPDRIREFMTRFLNERGLYIARKPLPCIAAALASVSTDTD